MRPGRIEKTLERNLVDLDAHLYFLRDEYAKTIGGDDDYFKKISNTLRNLICVSDKTEGLLWRIADALRADDSIEIQTAKGINKENLLAADISFALNPFRRPGKLHLPFPIEKLSLKTFVKEYEGLYFERRSYTHEQLIKLISQQMGSSHEAEGVDRFLVDLSAMSFSHRPALVEFLLSHASLTLEVGERILDFAKMQTGFRRRDRPEIIIPVRVVKPFSFTENEHFLGRGEDWGDYTIVFSASAPHTGWETDGRAYNLGLATNRTMACHIEKRSDSSLEVKVYTSSKVTIKRDLIRSRDRLDIMVFVLRKNGEERIVIGNSLMHDPDLIQK